MPWELLIGLPVLIVATAKVTTRVIAAEWFGAKRKHMRNVFDDCKEGMTDNG
jgi:hypothetical protein